MYSGKTVLITGSSRGVGDYLVNHFLENGAKVIGMAHNRYDGINFRQFSVDLSDSTSIVECFDRIKVELPDEGIDILINNAAILTSQYSTKMKVEDARAMVNIDLLAPFIVAREGVKLMKRVPYGRIINISSMAVTLEPQGDSMYAACKAGLEKMSNIMAKEFNVFGTTVNTLGISAIETDMLRQLNKEKVDKVVASLPIPRYATIEDIINVIDFFCSPKSNYITAQTIYLGGVHG